MRVTPWALLVLVPMLSACVSTGGFENADAATFAHSQLAGLARAQILACAGTPDHIASLDGKESLSYLASSGATSLALGSGGTLLSKERRSCEVIFVMRQGYVEEVRYVGAQTGGLLTPDEECAAIIKRCTGAR